MIFTELVVMQHNIATLGHHGHTGHLLASGGLTFIQPKSPLLSLMAKIWLENHQS